MQLAAATLALNSLISPLIISFIILARALVIGPSGICKRSSTCLGINCSFLQVASAGVSSVCLAAAQSFPWISSLSIYYLYFGLLKCYFQWEKPLSFYLVVINFHVFVLLRLCFHQSDYLSELRTCHSCLCHLL